MTGHAAQLLSELDALEGSYGSEPWRLVEARYRQLISRLCSHATRINTMRRCAVSWAWRSVATLTLLPTSYRSTDAPCPG